MNDVVTRMKKKRVEIVSDQNIAPSVERGAWSIMEPRPQGGQRRAARGGTPEEKNKKRSFFLFIFYFLFLFFFKILGGSVRIFSSRLYMIVFFKRLFF